MTHDTGNLCLVVGGFNGATVHEYGTAGQGESVDLLIVDNLEGEGKLVGIRRFRDQLLAQHRNVVRGVPVVKQG
jgi:hypothetical protein